MSSSNLSSSGWQPQHPLFTFDDQTFAPPPQISDPSYDFSIQNSLQYLIFSNPQAINSLTSFHDAPIPQAPNAGLSQSTKLHMDTLDLLDLSAPSEMYNIGDFDLHNPSFELIPDLLDNSLHPYVPSLSLPTTFQPASSHFDTLLQHPHHQYPYTPSLSDAYTPTFSDPSYTPEEVRAPVPLKHSLHSFTSTTPPLHSGKVSKKPSFSRINLAGKKLMILTSSPMEAHHQQPHAGLGLSTGVSPLTNKYKGLDINPPRMMPPLNVFRHNSDSSTSSYYSDTPNKRKNYPLLNDVGSRLVSKKSSRTSLNTIDSPLSLAASTPSHSNIPIKPKKYTRRRLLPRSKNGCWICRIKHLKCDEIRPVCTSCAKFGIDCDYSEDKPSYVTDKNLRKDKLESISLIRKQKQSKRKQM